jgi:hypothetical protein
MDKSADETKPPKWRVALAVLLWVLTSVLSIVLIPVTLDVISSIFAAFWGAATPLGGSYWSIVFIRQILLIPLAILSVAIVIGGAEYHVRAFNTERSWALFSRTLALEVAVLLVGWTL